jgi:hypothetical protein
MQDSKSMAGGVNMYVWVCELVVGERGRGRQLNSANGRGERSVETVCLTKTPVLIYAYHKRTSSWRAAPRSSMDDLSRNGLPLCHVLNTCHSLTPHGALEGHMGEDCAYQRVRCTHRSWKIARDAAGECAGGFVGSAQHTVRGLQGMRLPTDSTGAAPRTGCGLTQLGLCGLCGHEGWHVERKEVVETVRAACRLLRESTPTPQQASK